MGNFIANIEFAGLKMFVDHHKHTVGKLFMLVCDVLFQDSPLSVNTKTLIPTKPEKYILYKICGL